MLDIPAVIFESSDDEGLSMLPALRGEANEKLSQLRLVKRFQV